MENHIHLFAWMSYKVFTITAGLPSERKISFVLHEPDNGSEGSSNTTVTLQVVFIATKLFSNLSSKKLNNKKKAIQDIT